MAEPLHASTETPKQAPGGFPPFKTETFPSQIFWLGISFAVLFVVLWRIAGPRINGVITMRRNAINDDIAKADKARGDAEAASAAYQTALAGARARAQSLAEDNRQKLNAEIAKAKADAEAEAALAIVARLTGENVTEAEVAAALKEA